MRLRLALRSKRSRNKDAIEEPPCSGILEIERLERIEPALVRPLVRRLERTPDSIRGIERLERFELTAVLVIVSSVLNDPELR